MLGEGARHLDGCPRRLRHVIAVIAVEIIFKAYFITGEVFQDGQAGVGADDEGWMFGREKAAPERMRGHRILRSSGVEARRRQQINNTDAGQE